jgi:hypothetical protein
MVQRKEMKPLAAIIIEGRYYPNLKKIVDDHAKFLPSGTDIYIFDGSIHTKTTFASGGKNYFIEGISVKSLNEYNELLTNPKFWDKFTNYNRVLIFQTDSMLLRKGIEEFYDWDYVGAQFPFQRWGGNGGLSLRNPKTMKLICEKYPYIPQALGNEDVYVSNIMHDKSIGLLAPFGVCGRFSVESLFSLGTLGYHAIEKYLTPTQCKQIKEQYV